MKNVVEINENQTRTFLGTKSNGLWLAIITLTVVYVPVIDNLLGNEFQKLGLIFIPLMSISLSFVLAYGNRFGVFRSFGLSSISVFISLIAGIIISVNIDPDPKAHNLFPIELMIDLIFILPSALLGALMAMVLIGL